MVFQWYLFVLLLAVAWFASAARQTYTIEIHGRTERRYGWLPVLCILVPLILLAGTRSNIGDTAAYRSHFLNLDPSVSGLAEMMAASGKDKGYSMLAWVLKNIIGNRDKVYFTIIAAICLTCVIVTFKKHSCNFIMSMFLFVASSDYIQWNYNGMRQFVAVSVIFAATDLLLKKRYVLYYGIVLLMSTIHASALLMIPASLIVQGKAWNMRTLLFMLVSLVAINFSGALRNLIAGFMEETQYRGEVNQFLGTEGTNILRVLVFSIPPLIAFLFRRRLHFANDPLLNISANMSIMSMGFYVVSAVTSGIFVGRIPIYFSLYNYILLPWLVENAFEKRSAQLINAAIIACYLVFYYYQMTVAWDFSAYM